MIEKDLLDLLVCPETREKLSLAGADLITRVNRAIAAGKCANKAGQRVSTPVEGGLVPPDGRLMYPIQEGIPNLIIDEAIPIDGI